MSTGTDVITDVSNTHKTLSSHDSGTYTSVMYVCNKLQLLTAVMAVKMCWARDWLNLKL